MPRGAATDRTVPHGCQLAGQYPRSTCVRDGKETVEIRDFSSHLPRGVQGFSHAVRSHEGIEGTCQSSLDIADREDESCSRHDSLRENVAWLNRFTLSLLKRHPRRDSRAMKRRSCDGEDNVLVQTLTGFNHGMSAGPDRFN